MVCGRAGRLGRAGVLIARRGGLRLRASVSFTPYRVEHPSAAGVEVEVAFFSESAPFSPGKTSS
jgi:hypothetical protein